MVYQSSHYYYIRNAFKSRTAPVKKVVNTLNSIFSK